VNSAILIYFRFWFVLITGLERWGLASRQLCRYNQNRETKNEVSIQLRQLGYIFSLLVRRSWFLVETRNRLTKHNERSSVQCVNTIESKEPCQGEKRVWKFRISDCEFRKGLTRRHKESRAKDCWSLWKLRRGRMPLRVGEQLFPFPLKQFPCRVLAPLREFIQSGCCFFTRRIKGCKAEGCRP